MQSARRRNPPSSHFPYSLMRVRAGNVAARIAISQEQRMASTRPAPSKQSKGKLANRGRRNAPSTSPRAQRDDTTEARAQQRRAPKTHFPARTPGARRKDKA